MIKPIMGMNIASITTSIADALFSKVRQCVLAVFAELRALVLKTMGLTDVLRAALLPIAPQISLAFVFGSMAKQQDTSSSDIDVLLVRDTLGYGDVFAALEHASQTLGRSINPALYSAADFQARQLSDNAFINRVMQQPKIWLIGQEESPQHEPTHHT